MLNATSGRCWSQGQQVVEKLLSNIASLEKSLLAFAAVLHWQKLLFGLSQGKIVGTDQTGWFRVTPDELMGMLGEALKAGVPMDRSQTLSSGAPQVATQKQPGNSSFGMQLKTTHGTVSNSLPTSKATTVSPHVPSAHVSQTSISAQVSSSKQQLVQLV